jgi:predicted component of type VI protein secretion system
MAVPPLTPPPNPYATPDAPVAATLAWAGGQYTVRPGGEVLVGRDPGRCPIALSEPRVSGVHAALRFEDGQVWVRDEGSNNGTYLQGARLQAGIWTPVPPGPSLRVGPIDMLVRLEMP